jgi:glycosyltransferase involved in cell wall biosynthesis
MKILMVGRPELFEHYGGDRIQIENTVKELQKLGADVEISTDLNVDMKPFDIIHVFQLDWNPSCYFFIKKAKKLHKPIVFSPIHHKLSEVERFEKEYAFDFRRLSGWIIRNQFHRDLVKDLYRSILYPGKFPITAFSMFYGMKKMYKEALSMSDLICVQTKIEAIDLENVFDIHFKWEIVLNGVSDSFLQREDPGLQPGDESVSFHPQEKTRPWTLVQGTSFLTSPNNSNLVGLKDYLLCVGRIEPRKNQLNVIKAVQLLRDETHKDLQLVLIGAKSQNKHFEYTWLVNKELNRCSWIKHISHIDYINMPLVYKYASVGISASWFETTGLTSLEALICGANAVASGEQPKEYLGDYAYYCDPGNVISIKNAVKQAYNSSRPVLPEEFKKRYTWNSAAKKTLEIYKSLLEK